MKEELLWPILYVIVSIGAFLLFLREGSISSLGLGLVFLPVVFIEMYRIKKLSFKILLSGLLGVVLIQGISVLYTYLNKFTYLKNSNDYIIFYCILGLFICTILLFVYFYRKGDILNKNQIMN